MKITLKNARTALVLLTAAIFLAAPVTVQAKASSVRLNVNRTYEQYDLTGDGKADRLKVSSDRLDRYTYRDYRIHLNGKKALSVATGRLVFDLKIERLQLDNKKIYLAIIPVSDNGDVPGAAIYQCKGGRFSKAADLNDMSKIGYHNSVRIIKAAGNKITVEHSVMSYALGSISFRLDYQYKNGKLVQVTTKPKLTDFYLKHIKKAYWTSNYTLPVLRSLGGKRVATLKKGQKAKIDRICLNAKHNKIYLHVKIKGGRSGWVKGWTKDTSLSTSTGMFAEVQYTG